MEYYRLLLGPKHCESSNHVQALLKCAYPPLGTKPDDFSKLQAQWPKMCFSKDGLDAYFRPRKEPIGFQRSDDSWDVARKLLSCTCTDCRGQRNSTPGITAEPEGARTAIVEAKNDDTWLLLPILVYLGKFHFIYRLLRSPIPEKGPHSAESYLKADSGDLSALFGTSLERKTFMSAYMDVLHMCDPVVFKLQTDGLCPQRDYPPVCRFPFWDDVKGIRQGLFGNMTKFEIPLEYLDNSITTIMAKYPGSVTGSGREARVSNPSGRCVKPI